MSYTKITKPGAQTYTNLAKPVNSFSFPAGTATGLLISLTYATTHTVGTMYTKISKPSTNSYTKIAKPT